MVTGKLILQIFRRKPQPIPVLSYIIYIFIELGLLLLPNDFLLMFEKIYNLRNNT